MPTWLGNNSHQEVERGWAERKLALALRSGLPIFSPRHQSREITLVFEHGLSVSRLKASQELPRYAAQKAATKESGWMNIKTVESYIQYLVPWQTPAISVEQLNACPRLSSHRP
jgi:hypothetical protein